MRIDDLSDAIFLNRENRFAATVSLGGRRVLCHVPNSGRLRELLVPGAAARVKPSREGGRTQCGLVMVKHEGCWVVIDAHRANAVAREAILAGLVPGLERAENLRMEVKCGASRFDMACTVSGRPCYIEVKCSTLCVDGTALFPDAPTERGCKHLRELAELSRQGADCHVLFALQNPRARTFAPNRVTDPEFADALALAAEAGVHVHALLCETDENSVRATEAISVVLAHRTHTPQPPTL